jgi:hypothetical protein
MNPFDLTIAAKIRWRMAYDRNPLLPVLQDKLAVKRYAAEKGVPSAKVIFQTDNPASIPFAELPLNCFIKANHGRNWNILKYGTRFVYFGSGHTATDMNGFYNLSATGVKELHPEDIIKITSEWINTCYCHEEWAYEKIVPAIFAEEIVEPEPGKETLDFRLYTFRGKVALINIGSPSMRKKKENIFFDANWQKITLKNNFEKEPAIIPDKPPFLREMVESAERLGRDVDFVRIDFFAGHQQFYVGEMTLYPFGGKDNRPTSDHEMNLFLGRQWKMGLWQTIEALWLEMQRKR